MLVAGAVLLFIGISGEIITGDRFRRFFDWDYPEAHARNTEWMKVKLGRAAIVAGVVAVVAGGVAEFV